MPSYDADDDYPLVEWAEDRDIVADPACPTCWGAGTDADGRPCPCLISALMAAFPEAAGAAEANMLCGRCDGDGEDEDGEVCLCLADDLRRQQELLEATEAAS
jgi:hypothetical protein